MTSAVPAINGVAHGWAAVAHHWRTIVQLLLAVAVVYIYKIEGPALLYMLMLSTAGFTLSLLLPMNYRIAFFVFLSFLGILVVLGPLDGMWLVLSGLIVIGICHAPVPMPYRVASLIVVGSVLAVLRVEWIDSPWSGAMWPILASMFMFRLILYVRALATGQAKPGIWNTLAYFFMLPNAALPLFPVIDNQIFQRTYFDREEAGIYEEGMLWILRGVIQLLVYRFVYHNILIDPLDVTRLSDVVQSLLSTFLLYLRVSGQFHLAVGVLHLFGFRLPETHKRYYLAHSFTDLWRRINIYWTEFMMKTVFYPTYFRMKRLGSAWALVLSTTAVFGATWILHSYQWFWLRGEFPLRYQDILFWGLLGCLVIHGGLKEFNCIKTNRSSSRWSWRRGLSVTATFSAFCLLWSLWSAESLSEWVWVLGSAAHPDSKGVILLFSALAIVLLLGGHSWQEDRISVSGTVHSARKANLLILAGLVLLACLTQPLMQSIVPRFIIDVVNLLRVSDLNQSDAAARQRGYYENLQVMRIIDDHRRGGFRRTRYRCPEAYLSGRLRERNDHLLFDYHDSVHTGTCWNDHDVFSTNAWGMRDREYALEKPPDTLRIAFFGPSHVAGWGVSDSDTFEQHVEERLNRELVCSKYRGFEVLNFGLDKYSLPQQVARLEDKGFDFSPDIAFVTLHLEGRMLTESYIFSLAERGISVPYESFRSLLESVGLRGVDVEGTPMPFPALREVATRLGIDTKMPVVEMQARARRIVDVVNESALQRFAEVSAVHGVKPMVLALNLIRDDVDVAVPYLSAIRENGLPVLNLFDVYPESLRDVLRVSPLDDHPNAAGQRLIGDRIYAELKRILGPECSSETTSLSDVPY